MGNREKNRLLTGLAEHHMTKHAAVARLAMIASMLICGVACVSTGPQAFNGGAIVLMLLGVSAGMLVPTFDARGVQRFAGILPDLVVICVFWWFASGYLLDYAGNAIWLGVVLLLALLCYTGIVIAIIALLRRSRSFRVFACVSPHEKGVTEVESYSRK